MNKLPDAGEITIKVYYEDTDSLGVVYYANYLKFFERGRTELVEGTGRSVQDWNREGFNFAVYKMSVTFLAPARLGDVCQVKTTVAGGTSFRVRMHQELWRDETKITEADVTLVCLDGQLQLREIPDALVTWTRDR